MIELIRQGLNNNRPLQRMWQERDLKDHYDVVIIGGGVHGLATAYYLARDHDITNVAVLEKRYVGGGGSGRNTAIIRSNYLTPDGVRFYDESVKLYEELALELDFNVMFSQRGHLTLAHSDSSVRTMRWRAERVKSSDTQLRSQKPHSMQVSTISWAPGMGLKCLTKISGSSLIMTSGLRMRSGSKRSLISRITV